MQKFEALKAIVSDPQFSLQVEKFNKGNGNRFKPLRTMAAGNNFCLCSKKAQVWKLGTSATVSWEIIKSLLSGS